MKNLPGAYQREFTRLRHVKLRLLFGAHKLNIFFFCFFVAACMDSLDLPLGEPQIFWDPHSSARTTLAGKEVSRRFRSSLGVANLQHRRPEDYEFSGHH